MNSVIGHDILGMKPSSLRSIHASQIQISSHEGILLVPCNFRHKLAQVSQGMRYPHRSLTDLENCLASMLVRASFCRKHLARPTLHQGGLYAPRPSISSRRFPSIRLLHTDSGQDKHLSTEEDSKSSATQTDSSSTINTLLQDEAFLPSASIEQQRDSDSYTVPPKLKPQKRAELKNLTLFLEELSHPTETDTLDTLFALYRALPTPRLHYLRLDETNLLLSRFMSAPFRTDMLMIRYLSVIDDMRATGISITRKEWITVINYVGQRYNLKLGFIEFEAAFKLWAELELKAGVELGPTVFNVLLDMASKAHQHDLVHVILAEMNDRRISYDRYTHTTLITWYGYLRDATAVRETFTRMVQRGEIIDNVVYNALILAFLRSNEWDTAKEIFMRMKTLGRHFFEAEKSDVMLNGLNSDGSPISRSRNSDLSRQLGQRLKYLAKEYRDKFGALPFPLDNVSQIYSGPNIVTFTTFLNYHCRRGEFEHVTTLLKEMKEFKIPLESSTFVCLFQGFAKHGQGRSKFSKWSPARIQEVYAALMKRVSVDMKLNTVLACEMIKAYAVTTRSRAKTLKVYRDIENLYGLGYGHIKEMDPVVKKVVQSALGGPLNQREKPAETEQDPQYMRQNHVDNSGDDTDITERLIAMWETYASDKDFEILELPFGGDLTNDVPTTE